MPTHTGADLILYFIGAPRRNISSLILIKPVCTYERDGRAADKEVLITYLAF